MCESFSIKFTYCICNVKYDYLLQNSKELKRHLYWTGLMPARMFITVFHSWMTIFIKWVLGTDKNYSSNTASLM